MSVDVLIVGAGPSGLIMGILLNQLGVSFRIIDKNKARAKESRALAIQARSMELFQSLGLVEKFLEIGRIAKGAEMFLRGRKRVSLEFSDIGRRDTPYPYLLLLSQAETERIFIEDLKLRGVEVERDTSLIDFAQDKNVVMSTVKKSDNTHEMIRAKYIIGCDGSHSEVRKILHLEFKGEAYQSEFIMADAKVEGDLNHDKLSVFLDPGKLGVVFPMQENQLSRVLTISNKKNPIDTSTTSSYPAALPEIQKSFSEAAHREVKLSDPEWVTKFYIHHRCVDKLRVNRAFVVGDAAHIHSPVGAQGMNTGLQDAANLAWKLALVIQEKSPQSILDTYHSERWPVAQYLIKRTDRLFKALISKDKGVLILRNSLFPTLAKIIMSGRKGRQIIFNFVSQLGIRYHPSAIVGPKAGIRMPNFLVYAGKEIFDLISGYKFHLLVFGDHHFQERIQDLPIHQVPSSSFKAQGFVLVRPDGYIAFESNSLNEKAYIELEKFLVYFGFKHVI